VEAALLFFQRHTVLNRYVMGSYRRKQDADEIAAPQQHQENGRTSEV